MSERERWADDPPSDSEDEPSQDPQKAAVGITTEGETEDLQKAKTLTTRKREAQQLQTAGTGAIAEREPDGLQCIECAEGLQEVRMVCWWGSSCYNHRANHRRTFCHPEESANASPQADEPPSQPKASARRAAKAARHRMNRKLRKATTDVIPTPAPRRVTRRDRPRLWEKTAWVTPPYAANWPKPSTAKMEKGTNKEHILAKLAKQPELAQPKEKPLGYGPLLSCWPPNLYGKVTAHVPTATATPTADKNAQQMALEHTAEEITESHIAGVRQV